MLKEKCNETAKREFMQISDVRELLKDKRVIEEINRHLWIESQKAGYSIGIERATDEWIRLYAEGWMRYHMPAKHAKMVRKKLVAKKKASRKQSSQVTLTGKASSK